MALGTYSLRPGQHPDTGLFNAVIPVADRASSGSHGGKHSLMGTLVVHFLEQHVTRSAHIRDRSDLGWRGPMVTMARRAVWRRQVAALGQRLPMHAGAVLRELLGIDLVRRHVGGIRMAPSAGFREAQGVYRRQCVFYFADVVYAMAIDAGGHEHISGCQPLAVDAGLVLGQLIDALLWFEAMHQACIAMAARAQPGYRRTRDSALESFGPAHGGFRVVGGPVASVAVGATEAVPGMNVGPESRCRGLQIALHDGVTLHA